MLLRAHCFTWSGPCSLAAPRVTEPLTDSTLPPLPTRAPPPPCFPRLQIGKESRWNVDGELLANNHITAEVHRGLVEVFARGVEK